MKKSIDNIYIKLLWKTIINLEYTRKKIKNLKKFKEIINMSWIFMDLYYNGIENKKGEY